MDSFLTQWLLLVAIFGVATISPGPDFVMVLKNALTYGRRAGIFTAIGFGLGVGVHVTYTLAGLAAVIASSVLLFTVMKIIGAAYLFYVGIQAIRSKGWRMPENLDGSLHSTRSDGAALSDGFWTNVLNPKATLFFLAIFTQIVDPAATTGHQIILGLTCMLMVFLWFACVAIFMTTPSVRAIFVRLSQWVDRVCGALFIALGIKLMLTKLST